MEEIKSEETNLKCESCKKHVKIYPVMYCNCGVSIMGDLKEDTKSEKDFLYFKNKGKVKWSI